MNYDIRISQYGTKFYYVNNKLHREDGPAIEYDDGDKEWYKNGLLHREDGPAIENANGYKAWHKNGKYHREDGPAEIFLGITRWYFNGILYGENNEFNLNSWKKFIKTLIFS